MKRTEMRLEQLKDWFSQARSQILAISPYMTPSTLAECLSKVSPEVDVTVVCSWRTNDLLFGSSKIETYDLCQDNGWSLRVDHDGMPRTIHLKAYMVDGQMAMIGSANMTGRGMEENIESLVPVSIDSHPSLAESIEDSIAGSIPVDQEVYRQFREHASTLPEYEESEIPLLTVIHGALETEILREMPPEPNISDLLQLPSIRKALPVRGLRFGEVRRILGRKPLRDLGPGTINDTTKDTMHRIVESDSRFDIQKRYGTDCLVWKVHHIFNQEIRRHLRPHIGKPLSQLGLDESLWGSDTMGSKSNRILECCLNLLPEEHRDAIGRLATWEGTLRLKEDGGALYPRPFGERLHLTDHEGKMLENTPENLLPEDRLRNELWLPAFWVIEAPKGATLGEVVLRGFGLWESDHRFVQAMERDFEDDIRTLGEQEDPFFENPFRKMSETEALHTKVAASGGKTHLPLGHPDRPVSRWLNTGALTSIAEDILGDDH